MFLAICSSALTAIGGYSALNLFVLVAWSLVSAHPIATPFNALVGLFSLCFFLFSFYLYIRMARKTHRRWLLLLDISLYLGLLPVFFSLWAQFYNFLTKL